MWNAREPAAAEAAAAAEALRAAQPSEQSVSTVVLDSEDTREVLEEADAAEGDLESTGAEEAVTLEEQSETGEAGAEPELSAAAGDASTEGTADDSTGKWKWQVPFASPGASPLDGLRRRFLELFSPKGTTAATAQEHTDQSSPPDGEAAQGSLQAATDGADARLDPGVFAPGEDRLEHFSLHRSHRRMFVSTAETAAAMAAEGALQLPEEALQPTGSDVGQPQIAVAEDTPQADDVQSAPVAAVESVEQQEALPAEECKAEEPQKLLQESAVDAPDAGDSAPALQDGSQEIVKAEESAAAEGQALLPAAPELMKVDLPSFSLPDREPHPEPEAAKAEATKGDSTSAPTPQQPQAATPAAESSAEEDEPEQAQAAEPQGAEPADEAEPSPGPSDVQQQPLPAPEELPAAAVEPIVPETALPVVEEAAALQASKPDLAPSAAPATAVSPEAGSGRASSKAKHSWQSPALSARYGEVEDNEPRYKPRRPNADASTSKASHMHVIGCPSL